MNDDPTRATPLPESAPMHGSVGPDDPHEDPRTVPALRPDGPAVRTDPTALPDAPTQPTGTGDGPTEKVPAPPVITRTRTSGLWTGLILSAVVLVVLLVFILQNLDPVTVNFLGLSGSLPVGVALLLAAIAGLLLVAIPGGVRMLQLRKAARRAARR
jgi:uncharacterized integral membrane protein